MARGKKSTGEPDSWERDLGLACYSIANRARGWPRPEYQKDPVRFAREVLGIEPWDKQREILESLVVENARVAVSSGHKIGKSNTAAIIALWFYCSFPDARVCMTCVTARQVDAILYREVRKLHAASHRKLSSQEVSSRRERGIPTTRGSFPVDGDVGEKAATGIRSKDFRELVGFTAKQKEAVAGISGEHILYIVDEASGVDDEIFEAIEGNRAGGARIILFSNPTRTEGEFFEAFESKQTVYTATFRVSSEDTPNVKEGRKVIPGLATREWIEEKKQEWGVDSPLYQIRVKGNHVRDEQGKIFSLHLLAIAEEQQEEASQEGRLYIGVDPAGPGEEGDESGFSWRRDKKHLGTIAKRGIDGPAQLREILGIIKENKVSPRELPPVVVIDGLGKAGAELAGTCRVYLQRQPHAFELVIVRGSDNATREPRVYVRTRDELHANLAQWIKDGGGINPDVKLIKDLSTPVWKSDVTGRLYAEPKPEIKKRLGRSPDRGDSLMLCVWETRRTRAQENANEESSGAPVQSAEHSRGRSDAGAIHNPYGGSIDPYGAG